MEKTTLTMKVSFEVDPQDEEKIAPWALSELEGIIFEVREVSRRVLFRYGETVIRGRIKIVQPTPLEMKQAQLKRERSA
jgi:hypothetical protein